MKTFLMAATLASIALTAALPVNAAMTSAKGLFDASILDGSVDKRRKPRVPGGSGCNSPRDIIEHPECTPAP